MRRHRRAAAGFTAPQQTSVGASALKAGQGAGSSERAQLSWLWLSRHSSPATEQLRDLLSERKSRLPVSLPARRWAPRGEAAEGKAGLGLSQILPLFTFSLSTDPAKLKSQTTRQKWYFSDVWERHFEPPANPAAFSGKCDRLRAAGSCRRQRRRAAPLGLLISRVKTIMHKSSPSPSNQG